MHHIPKIAYGGLIQTEIILQYPPRTDEGESYETQERVTKSISGVRQVQVDHTEAVRNVVFSSLSEEEKSEFVDFYLLFAQYGRGFRYYNDQNSADFVAYELKDYKFNPRKVGIRGENRYAWEIPFSFVRVIGKTDGGGYVQQEILNQQLVPEPVEELTLDSVQYKSVRVFFEITRSTDTEDRVANGQMVFVYLNGTWQIDPGSFSGIDPGVTFTIDPQGQVYYTSDLMPGANYSGGLLLRNFTIVGG